MNGIAPLGHPVNAGRLPFRRAVVLGAGAVGSFLGARLSSVMPTVLVGRREHVEAVRRDGLRLTGTVSETVRPDAEETLPPGGGASGQLAARAARGSGGEPALVVVTVKSRSLPGAAAALAAASGLRAGASVLCIQNGLEPDATLRSALASRGRGDLRVLRALVGAGLNLVRPGEVEYWGGGLAFPDTEEAAPVATLFERAGVPVSRERDFAAEVWKKLAVNCVANPLSAVLGVRNREVVSPELADLRRAVVEEVRLCARDAGIDLPSDLAERVDRALSASGNRNSMLQDLDRGRPTEIDELNGRVAALARERGRRAPANETLARLVRFLESRAAGASGS